MQDLQSRNKNGRWKQRATCAWDLPKEQGSAITDKPRDVLHHSKWQNLKMVT